MKTHTSKKALWLKSLLLLPLLALLLYSFSDKQVVEIERNTNSSETTTLAQMDMKSQTLNGQDIEILINRYGQLLVNLSLVKMEDLPSFLLKYNEGLTKEQRSQTVRSIITIDKDAPKEVIKQVEAILTDYGVATINIQGKTATDQEKKVTKAEIKEYNALASKYNSQEKEKKVIKTKDMRRLKELYDRMTLEQKASAEPYPNFPPPPPPAAAPKVIKNSELPPPPPLPENAPAADKMAYEKAVKNYKKGNPVLVYDHINEDGEMVEVVVISDENNVAPPPPPMPPSKHLAKLAEEGAKFYLNGNPISSEEALKIAEKNKDININIEGVDSEPPMVKITTKTKKN